MLINNRGWIMLEVILCLALFALVLQVAQHQSETQWHTLQQAEIYRQNMENQQKQASMRQLMGAESWLSKTPNSPTQGYPDCQVCTGDQLKQWFYATQQIENRSQNQAGVKK